MLVGKHQHHIASMQWFESRAKGEVGLCRVVQLSLIRLLGNASVIGEPVLPATDAWRLIKESLDDERVEFLLEPSNIDTVLPNLFQYPVPTPKLINDAYLAAFAMASGRRLVTRDRGFLQFRGLEVELLGQ